MWIISRFPVRDRDILVVSADAFTEERGFGQHMNSWPGLSAQDENQKKKNQKQKNPEYI